MSTTDEIMGMVQEYASAWSLVGSRFDNGHGMECADEARSALLKAVEEMAADAARYQFIRNGGAYIEPNHYDEDGKQIKEMYMATETGKYYTDMRDFDMDLNEAMQKETP